MKSKSSEAIIEDLNVLHKKYQEQAAAVRECIAVLSQGTGHDAVQSMKKPAQTQNVVAAVRLPRDLYEAIMERVHIDAEDIDFSKFVRRAIRREFENSGFGQFNKTKGFKPTEEGGR